MRDSKSVVLRGGKYSGKWSIPELTRMKENYEAADKAANTSSVSILRFGLSKSERGMEEKPTVVQRGNGLSREFTIIKQKQKEI